MSDRPGDNDAVPQWVRDLGITDRLTGQERARASWNALISAGRKVLGTGMDYRVEHLLLSLASSPGRKDSTRGRLRPPALTTPTQPSPCSTPTRRMQRPSSM